jgi:hypothetical protein
VWPILKRCFTPERLVGEVGGELLLSGPSFVIVPSPR